MRPTYPPAMHPRFRTMQYIPPSGAAAAGYLPQGHSAMRPMAPFFHGVPPARFQPGFAFQPHPQTGGYSAGPYDTALHSAYNGNDRNLYMLSKEMQEEDHRAAAATTISATATTSGPPPPPPPPPRIPPPPSASSQVQAPAMPTHSAAQLLSAAPTAPALPVTNSTPAVPSGMFAAAAQTTSPQSGGNTQNPNQMQQLFAAISSAEHEQQFEDYLNRWQQYYMNYQQYCQTSCDAGTFMQYTAQFQSYFDYLLFYRKALAQRKALRMAAEQMAPIEPPPPPPPPPTVPKSAINLISNSDATRFQNLASNIAQNSTGAPPYQMITNTTSASSSVIPSLLRGVEQPIGTLAINTRMSGNVLPAVRAAVPVTPLKLPGHVTHASTPRMLGNMGGTRPSQQTTTVTDGAATTSFHAGRASVSTDLQRREPFSESEPESPVGQPISTQLRRAVLGPVGNFSNSNVQTIRPSAAPVQNVISTTLSKPSSQAAPVRQVTPVAVQNNMSNTVSFGHARELKSTEIHPTRKPQAQGNDYASDDLFGDNGWCADETRQPTEESGTRSPEKVKVESKETNEDSDKLGEENAVDDEDAEWESGAEEMEEDMHEEEADPFGRPCYNDPTIGWLGRRIRAQHPVEPYIDPVADAQYAKEQEERLMEELRKIKDFLPVRTKNVKRNARNTRGAGMKRTVGSDEGRRLDRRSPKREDHHPREDYQPRDWGSPSEEYGSRQFPPGSRRPDFPRRSPSPDYGRPRARSRSPHRERRSPEHYRHSPEPLSFIKPSAEPYYEKPVGAPYSNPFVDRYGLPVLSQVLPFAPESRLSAEVQQKVGCAKNLMEALSQNRPITVNEILSIVNSVKTEAILYQAKQTEPLGIPVRNVEPAAPPQPIRALASQKSVSSKANPQTSVTPKSSEHAVGKRISSVVKSSTELPSFTELRRFQSMEETLNVIQTPKPPQKPSVQPSKSQNSSAEKQKSLPAKDTPQASPKSNPKELKKRSSLNEKVPVKNLALEGPLRPHVAVKIETPSERHVESASNTFRDGGWTSVPFADPDRERPASPARQHSASVVVAPSGPSINPEVRNDPDLRNYTDRQILDAAEKAVGMFSAIPSAAHSDQLVSLLQAFIYKAQVNQPPIGFGQPASYHNRELRNPGEGSMSLRESDSSMPLRESSETLENRYVEPPAAFLRVPDQSIRNREILSGHDELSITIAGNRHDHPNSSAHGSRSYPPDIRPAAPEQARTFSSPTGSSGRPLTGFFAKVLQQREQQIGSREHGVPAIYPQPPFPFARSESQMQDHNLRNNEEVDRYRQHSDEWDGRKEREESHERYRSRERSRSRDRYYDREERMDKKRYSPEPVRQSDADRNRTTTVSKLIPLPDLLPRGSRRLKKLTVILRGPPGSGKSWVAKKLKDIEPEMRILSIDDYFEESGERGETDSFGRITRKEPRYVYDPKMEEKYRRELEKVYKKKVDDPHCVCLVVDACNEKVDYFMNIYKYGDRNGHEVVVGELPFGKPFELERRSSHGRSGVEIEEVLRNWELTPSHMFRVDLRGIVAEMPTWLPSGEGKQDTTQKVPKISMKLTPKAPPKSKWEDDEESAADAARNPKKGTKVAWVEKAKSPPLATPLQKWIEKRAPELVKDKVDSGEKSSSKKREASTSGSSSQKRK